MASGTKSESLSDRVAEQVKLKHKTEQEALIAVEIGGMFA